MSSIFSAGAGGIGEQYIDLVGNELRRKWRQINNIRAADAQFEDDVCSFDVAEIRAGPA